MRVFVVVFSILLMSLHSQAQVKNIDLGFDGSNDYVEIPNFGHAEDITIQFWAFGNSSADGQCWFGRHDASGGNIILFGMYGGGIQVRIKSETYTSGNAITGWYHMAVSLDKNASGTFVTVYRNGSVLWSRQFSETYNNNLVSSDRPWVIGMDWDGNMATDFYSGWIDEFIVWNGQVGNVTIQESMNGTPQYFGGDMAVYYPFQYTGIDISGNERHATLHGAAFSTQSGKSMGRPAGVRRQPPTNQAMVLNGTNAYLELPTTTAFDMEINGAVQCWILVNEFNRNWQAIVTKGDNSWRLHRYQDTGFINWAMNGPSPGGITSTVRVDDGKWHHIVAGKYNDYLTLFIDGQLDVSQRISGNTSRNGSPVLIGENAQATGRFFNGTIADVRIHTITPYSAIHENMSSSRTLGATLGHWSLDGTPNDKAGLGRHGFPRGDVIYRQVSVLTSTEEEPELQPSETELTSLVYPNPFNPSTNILYSLPQAAQVTVAIYDLAGRKLQTLVNEFQPAGEQSVTFQAENLQSGLYLYRIEAGSYTKSGSMTLVK